MFKMAHFEGLSSQRPNLQRCGQLFIVGVEHGRFSCCWKVVSWEGCLSLLNRVYGTGEGRNPH